AQSSDRPAADCHGDQPVQRPVFPGQGRQRLPSPGHRLECSGGLGRRHRRPDRLGFLQRPTGVARALV
ncbi:hypothetical protein, partial [Pseudomonas fluorescens]